MFSGNEIGLSKNTISTKRHNTYNTNKWVFHNESNGKIAACAFGEMCHFELLIMWSMRGSIFTPISYA